MGGGLVEGPWVGGGSHVPCVRDDDVVKGSVLFAEAGEAYSEDHGCVQSCCATMRWVGGEAWWTCWRELFEIAEVLPGESGHVHS